MTQIELHPFTAADRDWLIRAHIETYERDEGFDASFGVLIAQILDDFLGGHDFAKERGWIAWRGKTRLGSIFCVRVDDCRAQLRLFQLLPEARGHGIGRLLLGTCTQFAREAGYEVMTLSTHKSHEAAVALYLQNDWVITEEEAVVSYGQQLIEQTLILSL